MMVNIASENSKTILQKVCPNSQMIEADWVLVRNIKLSVGWWII